MNENSALICLAIVFLKINLLLEYYNKILWLYVAADDIFASTIKDYVNFIAMSFIC